MRKFNLFYLIDGGNNWGGAESNLLSVAKRINRGRYYVEIGCLVGGRVADTFKSNGLPVTVIDMKNKWDVVAVIRLARLLKGKKIDVLHTALYSSNTFGRIAAILARTPVSLVWEQNQAQQKRPRHVRVDKILNKFTDAIVAASSAVKHSIVEVEGIGESKIQVVHNCVEPSAFDRSSDTIATVGARCNVPLQSDLKLELGLRPEDRVLPYVASLGPRKGHKYFLPAIREVVKVFPDVKFLFMGEGALRGEIEREIERLGIKGNVLLCGFRRDVPEILTIAEFYVHPATVEAFGVAVLEAMVMGKAVVANRVDGIPEVVVEGETGLLVEPKDPEALARAIIELLQSPSRVKEMGRKGRERALNCFSAERTARELEKIYEQFILVKVLSKGELHDEEAQRLRNRWMKEFYAHHAEGREEWFTSTPSLAYNDKVRQRALTELLRPARGEKILEVGCGGGSDAILFSSRGVRYMGTDCGYRIVKVAKERSAKGNHGGAFAVADATQLPFKDCSFDKVSCSEVLEHIPEYTKALKEINRVLRPDGKAAFTVPNRHSLRRMFKLYRLFIYKVFNRCDLHPYDEWKTRKELKTALRESGLEVQEELGVDFTQWLLDSRSLSGTLITAVEFLENKLRWTLPGCGNTLAVLAVKGPLENADKAPTVNILYKENLTFLLFRKLQDALSGKGIGKIPGVVPLYMFIYRKLKPDGVILRDIQGNKMYMDCSDEVVARRLLTIGVYERLETEWFKEQIRPGMVVVDIGANIGYYTLIAAKLVGNEGKVYAFEPVSNNYDLLTASIKVNGYTNVIPIPKAVSNRCGKARLFISRLNMGAPSFSQGNIKESVGVVEVETITLDKFFESAVGVGKVDFLKMDVQGSEGLVIEGAEKVLKGNNLKILMEFCPYGLKNVGTDPLKLLHRLQDYGFKIKLVGNSSTGCTEIQKIIEICESAEDGKGEVNLFLEK